MRILRTTMAVVGVQPSASGLPSARPIVTVDGTYWPETPVIEMLTVPYCVTVNE